MPRRGFPQAGTHPLLQRLRGPPWLCSSHSPRLGRILVGSQFPLLQLGPHPSALQLGSPPQVGAHSAFPSLHWVTDLRSQSPGPWAETCWSLQGPWVCHCFPPGKGENRRMSGLDPRRRPSEFLMKVVCTVRLCVSSHKQMQPQVCCQH